MHLLEIHHKCIELIGLSMNHIWQVKLSLMHLLETFQMTRNSY